MKNENENENKNLRDVLKEKFEENVNVEFNDFVFESIVSMITKYETSPSEMKKALYILNKNLNKLKTYDDLMRFLAGILKNTAARNQELIIRK